VALPATDGEIEILPGHLPFITIVQPGELVVKRKTSQEFFALDFGFAMTSNDAIFFFVDESLKINEADLAK
jgi:F0F1-type ATP synthase epsilon subunit